MLEKKGSVYRFGYMRYCSVDHGIILNKECAVQYVFDEPFNGYAFEGNFANHTLVVYDIEDNKISERISVSIRHNCVVTFKESGHYWEGDVYDTRPYGWGCLYNKNKKLLYEGFRIDSINLCYGTSYYPDTLRIRYQGSYYFGLQWGEGSYYDKEGNLVYQGVWLNNEKNLVSLIKSVYDLHSMIEELYVSKGSANSADIMALDLSFYMRLKRIVVGTDCFNAAASFVVKYAPLLLDVRIAARSFACEKGSVFRIEQCERLSAITLERGSFPQYALLSVSGGSCIRV